ncbi:hypothetical protein V8U11_05955 [Pseudomonas chlororaphis]|uniref:hypothetical protein n=1 Tax=Pseudomonas chlororaphis TaxID=587753 RepID=UPI0030CBD59C
MFYNCPRNSISGLVTGFVKGAISGEKKVLSWEKIDRDVFSKISSVRQGFEGLSLKEGDRPENVSGLKDFLREAEEARGAGEVCLRMLATSKYRYDERKDRFIKKELSDLERMVGRAERVGAREKEIRVGARAKEINELGVLAEKTLASMESNVKKTERTLGESGLTEEAKRGAWGGCHDYIEDCCDDIAGRIAGLKLEGGDLGDEGKITKIQEAFFARVSALRGRMMLLSNGLIADSKALGGQPGPLSFGHSFHAHLDA